jgi:hypothetical protein
MLIIMKPSFVLSSFNFFEITSATGETVLNYLSNTCGLYKIAESTWRSDLLTLPSPIRASDCVAVYVSGLIPTGSASIDQITLDIIRKESNPKKYEPEYNLYFHYIIRNSHGSYFISETLKPDNHWAVAVDLKQHYSDL